MVRLPRNNRQRRQTVQLRQNCHYLQPRSLLIVELHEDAGQKRRHRVFKTVLGNFQIIHQFLNITSVKALEALACTDHLQLLRLFLPFHVVFGDLDLIAVLGVAERDSPLIMIPLPILKQYLLQLTLHKVHVIIRPIKVLIYPFLRLGDLIFIPSHLLPHNQVVKLANRLFNSFRE